MRAVLKKSVVLLMVFAMVFSFSFSVSAATTKSKTINLKSTATTVSATLTDGDKLQLTVKDNNKEVKAANVKFKSSNTSVATVSAKGLVSTKNKGTATVTITANKKTVKLNLTVKEAITTKVIKLESGATATNATIAAGSKLALAIRDNNTAVKAADAKFSSSKTAVATVSAGGIITAKNAGATTITIKAKKKTVKFVLTVLTNKSIPLDSSTTTSSATIGAGDKLYLTVKNNGKVVNPANVTFTSSKTSVATVNAKGVITAKKAGTSVVTVKSGNKSFQVNLTVLTAKTINMESTATTVSASMTAGKKLLLSVKDNKVAVNVLDAAFASSNTPVATVSSKGVVTAKKAGSATITVKVGRKITKLKLTVKPAPQPEPEPGPEMQGELVTLPFMSTWDWNNSQQAKVTTLWNIQDLDWSLPNDKPNLNLTVAALLLATNIETHDRENPKHPNQWDQILESLATLGFTENPYHAYFDGDNPGQEINYPAMAFATAKEKVNGKTVVAAIFRGSSSIQDFITDAKSQIDKLLPSFIRKDDAEATIGGFYQVGEHATAALKNYLDANGLKKEDTTLFITGHSLGAATSSLVGLMSAYKGLAEKNSIFCYSFATPNYLKIDNAGLIMTGKDIKMFSFDNEEDIVPDVPLGLSYFKTQKRINFDREWIKAENPEQYALFDELYTYFRGRSYDEDNSYFMPKEYAYQFFSDFNIDVDSIMVRNHMPYTYMALILSELPADVARSYIGK